MTSLATSIMTPITRQSGPAVDNNRLQWMLTTFWIVEFMVLCVVWAVVTASLTERVTDSDGYDIPASYNYGYFLREPW